MLRTITITITSAFSYSYCYSYHPWCERAFSLWDRAISVTSHDRADVLRFVRFLGHAGKWFQVLKVSSRVFLVLPYIVHNVRDNHCKPAKHGHQHGVVGGPLGQVAQVRIHGQERLALLVSQLRTTTQHARGGLMVVRHAAQRLLQGAVAMPRVVVHHHTCLQPCERVLVHASDPVVGKVQHFQRTLQSDKRPLAEGFHSIMGEIEPPKHPQAMKYAIGHQGYVVSVQLQQLGVWRDVRRDLLQAWQTTGDVEAVRRAFGALAGATLGTGAGRRKAQDHEHQALQQQTHGDGAGKPQVQRRHADRQSTYSTPGPFTGAP